MPDHGVDLGADLYRLRLVARDDLPPVAESYQHSAYRLDDVGKLVAKAVVRPDFFGGTEGPVYDSWATLQQAMMEICRDTKSNLDATAEALKQAIEAYAATDSEAADEYHRLCQADG